MLLSVILGMATGTEVSCKLKEELGAEATTEPVARWAVMTVERMTSKGRTACAVAQASLENPEAQQKRL